MSDADCFFDCDDDSDGDDCDCDCDCGCDCFSAIMSMLTPLFSLEKRNHEDVPRFLSSSSSINIRVSLINCSLFTLIPFQIVRSFIADPQESRTMIIFLLYL